MSYLAKHFTRDASGTYLDAQGCAVEWGDALGEVLGFCGCGVPEDALHYARRVLRAVDMLKRDGWGRDHAAFTQWWDDVYKPALAAIFHGDSGAEYFAFYALTDKKLLEHGGAVPGWLTELGRDVLADLEALLPLGEAGT